MVVEFEDPLREALIKIEVGMQCEKGDGVDGREWVDRKYDSYVLQAIFLRPLSIRSICFLLIFCLFFLIDFFPDFLKRGVQETVQRSATKNESVVVVSPNFVPFKADVNGWMESTRLRDPKLGQKDKGLCYGHELNRFYSGDLKVEVKHRLGHSYMKDNVCRIAPLLEEAAQSCNTILDTIEFAIPEGLPPNFGTECKLQETLCKAVKLLPEFWKLAGFSHEAISSYRQALLSHWNLDAETTAKIQKEFAIFLLYSGCEASPPNLRSQMDGSFVARN